MLTHSRLQTGRHVACSTQHPHYSARPVQGIPAHTHNRTVLRPRQLPTWSADRASTVVAQAASSESATPGSTINVPEVVKGCRTVLAELRGLDFPRAEVQLYFDKAVRLPRKFDAKGADMPRAAAVLKKLLQVDEDGDPLPPSAFTDPEGLALAQAVLNDLWRWRRRGGGMDLEEQIRVSQVALEELQGIDTTPQSVDTVSSSLLDGLQLTDAEKKEMGAGIQQVAVGAIQGAVWNALILCVGFLVFIQFFARGG